MQISILLINVSLYTTKCKGCKVGSSFKWCSLAKISQAKTYHRTFLFRVRSAFAPFCGLFLPTAFKSMVICPCLRLKAIVSEHRVLPVCCLSQCSSFKKFLGQAYYILLLKKSAFAGSLEPSAFFTFFAKLDNFKILISRSQSWHPNKKWGGELMFWIATVERDTNNMKKCLSGRLGGAHL